MRSVLKSEEGFTLYLTFSMLLLLSGMLLHVASQYQQESGWLELERIEALMQQAKTESLRHFLINESLTEPEVLNADYTIGDVEVQITLEPIDANTSELMLSMHFKEIERVEGFVFNHENEKINRFR